MACDLSWMNIGHMAKDRDMGLDNLLFLASFDTYIMYESVSSTYDHRTLKTRLPVRSALFKQRTGGLVVRWVTTSEYPLLYVFARREYSSDEVFEYGNVSSHDHLSFCQPPSQGDPLSKLHTFIPFTHAHIPHTKTQRKLTYPKRLTKALNARLLTCFPQKKENADAGYRIVQNIAKNIGNPWPSSLTHVERSLFSHTSLLHLALMEKSTPTKHLLLWRRPHIIMRTR
jgi:hypothetical protein